MATRLKRTLWQRLRRLAVFAVLLVLVGPFVLILPLNLVQPFTTTVILRRSVQRLFEEAPRVSAARRRLARRDLPNLRRAVLASEDDRFYLHSGFDFEEIENALERAKRGRRLRGASTITQQVAKNLFLWEGRSYVRKGLEAWLTVVLEPVFRRTRILDLYLTLAGVGRWGLWRRGGARTSGGRRRTCRDEGRDWRRVLPSPRKWSPKGSIASRRASGIVVRMRYPAPKPEDLVKR
ncbi:MAG: transglycosylase domain-containing protein [Gemmatimonadetes bacterium]|nr:transglycosylase domain-containing protein [Gemmatimonadota bacterium]